jgi:succinate dehydrogenase / fumarate reductase cytochrome b subunit
VKNKDRPTNVYPTDLLFSFSWPITALASITHRMFGVVLFVGVAFGLYGLELSLSSEEGFTALKLLIKSPFGMFVTWGLLAALAFHFVAGLKHLLMDLGVGETLEGSRRAAQLTFLFSIALMVLAAVWVVEV